MTKVFESAFAIKSSGIKVFTISKLVSLRLTYKPAKVLFPARERTPYFNVPSEGQQSELFIQHLGGQSIQMLSSHEQA